MATWERQKSLIHWGRCGKPALEVGESQFEVPGKSVSLSLPLLHSSRANGGGGGERRREESWQEQDDANENTRKSQEVYLVTESLEHKSGIQLSFTYRRLVESNEQE